MVQLLKKIRNCSGVGLHAWYESSLGYPIRKPNNSVYFLDSRTEEERKEDSKIKQETTSTKAEEIKIENKIMPEKTKYSFWVGLVKGIKYAILFLLGTLVIGIPAEWRELTMGGILVIIYNFLKIRWLNKLP